MGGGGTGQIGASDLVVGHLEELGVHVPGALPLLVEQEFVVAAVGADGFRRRRETDGRTPERN